MFLSILATVSFAQTALLKRATENQSIELGNLLGDEWEFVAIDHDGLTKAGAGARGFDAATPGGQDGSRWALAE